MNDASYFPRSHRSSVSSGTMSLAETPNVSEKATQTGANALRSAPSTASLRPKDSVTDPLSRDYPAPTDEVNLDEMLARTPQKWSVGHYVKTPAREVVHHQQDKERAAQEFAAKKRELLQAKKSLQNLSIGK